MRRILSKMDVIYSFLNLKSDFSFKRPSVCRLTANLCRKELELLVLSLKVNLILGKRFNLTFCDLKIGLLITFL